MEVKKIVNDNDKKEYAQIAEEGTDSSPEIEVLYPEEKKSSYEAFKFKLASFIVKYKNPLLVFSLILANYLYISCDQICPYFNDEDCVVKFMMPNAPIWIVKMTIVAIIFMTIILLGFLYKRIHIGFSIFAVINVIYLTLYYDNVIDHRRYGQIFGLFLQLELGALFFLFFLVRSISFCCKKSRRLTCILWPLGLFILFSCIYFGRVNDACAHWDAGLGGERINNDIYCKVEHPKVCGYDIIDGLMDLSIFMSCSKSKPNFNLMKQWYGAAADAPIIGFPRMEFAGNENRVDDKIQKFVFDNLVPLNSLDDPKAEDLEVFIDQRDKENVHVVMDLKRNETLVEERSKIQKDSIVKNILVLYVDTLSRPRAFKKLKKTMKWFDKFYNKKSDERESYQFLKFHSITPYTQNNVMAAFYGEAPPTNIKEHIPPPPAEPKKSHIKNFKEAGYITGRAFDMCDTSPLFIDRDLKLYFEDVPYDHEGNTIACDPQYYPPNSHLGMWVGPFSDIRRCLYGKDMYQYVIDYADQFWRTYATEKKFFTAEFIDAHESTQEVVTYLDDSLAGFLEGLEKENLLEDTLIMFWSDHGLHLPSFSDLFSQDAKAIERALPTLILTLPKTINNEYRVAVKGNQQKLVSAYQIHELFLGLAEGPHSSHISKSIMGDLPQLTCEDIRVSNQPCFCNYP